MSIQSFLKSLLNFRNKSSSKDSTQKSVEIALKNTQTIMALCDTFNAIPNSHEKVKFLLKHFGMAVLRIPHQQTSRCPELELNPIIWESDSVSNAFVDAALYFEHHKTTPLYQTMNLHFAILTKLTRDQGKKHHADRYVVRAAKFGVENLFNEFFIHNGKVGLKQGKLYYQTDVGYPVTDKNNRHIKDEPAITRTPKDLIQSIVWRFEGGNQRKLILGSSSRPQTLYVGQKYDR